MSIPRKYIFGYNFTLVRLIRIKIILPPALVAVGKVDDLIIRNPRVMAAHIFQIQRPDLTAVYIRREHVRHMPPRFPILVKNSPPVEKCYPFAVR